ncbi:MAG: cobalt-precorrin-5B (C(1))-methyltransferase [Alphaproteobacteria bacterium]|nr:cobalt-precorrin-5B (C(1))-methyltransferase [Alphaproteobacteria bacterium]
MVRRPTGALRRGWTTGACATAAAKAAFAALLTGRFPDPVTITLPKGERVAFALDAEALEGDAATAAVVKDAGDDPDVTHGCRVVALVRRVALGAGVVFRAGEGVGTVTRAGLALAPGEPAINPVPRQMIRAAIAEVAAAHGAGADAEITIAVPGGAALAQQTSNPRLGILGGLSILGTTGIVIPYSCASWIHSIHRGIDVARAAGLTHVAASTGRTSEAAAARHHGLPEIALIEMGDFAGGMLKYLREHPLSRLTIAGGFGKLAKLAAGHMDLHSGRSRVEVAALAATLATLGADADVIAKAQAAVGAGEVLALAGAAARPLADRIAAQARGVALATLAGGTAVEVMIFDREGALIGHAPA